MTQTQRIPLGRWALAFLIPACIGFTLHTQDFSYNIIMFGIITSFALCIWAMELLNDAVMAMALPVLYIVVGVAPKAKVLGVWSSSVGWLIVGGLMIGAFMMKTGLARRIALHCTLLTGGSFIRLLWGLLLAGLIMAPFIPSVLGRAAILAVISISICEALGLKKGSREGSAIILTGFLGASAFKMAFYTGGADQLMGLKLLAEATGENVSWFEFALHNFVPSIVYAILSLLLLLVVLRPKIEGNVKNIVEKQLAEMGAMSRDEYKSITLLAFLLVCLVTDRLHGIDVGWIMLLLPCLAFVPGVNLLDSNDLKKMNFPAVFFVVGCMSIGGAAMACGVDKILSTSLLPLLGGTELFTVMAMYFTGLILNLTLTPLAAYASLTTSLASLAQQLNVEPLLLFYSYTYGLDQYIFPYEYAILLYFYATGYTSMKHIMTIFGLRMILAAPFVALIAYPFWKLFI